MHEVDLCGSVRGSVLPAPFKNFLHASAPLCALPLAPFRQFSLLPFHFNILHFILAAWWFLLLHAHF